MPTILDWRTNLTVSCLHAAKAIVDGRRLADASLAEALSPAVHEVQRQIKSAGLSSEAAWRNMIPMAASHDGLRRLAELVVIKGLGRSERTDLIAANLADALTDLVGAMRKALPRLDEEMPLRVGPLRLQWEARGPGLLHCTQLFTEDGLIPDKATVVVVHPAIGGAGDAFPPYNVVVIEGVLANPVAELPETVRLGWLISQLNADLPKYGEAIHRDRLPHVAGFAFLPSVLQAAEEVELVRSSPDLLATAIDAWDLPAPPDVDTPELLDDWWSTYCDSRPSWGVALAALDQMFG